MVLSAGMVIHGGVTAVNAIADVGKLFMQSQADSDGGSAPDNWADPKELPGHFSDHGAQFKARSPTEYADKAHGFFERQSSGGIERAEGYGQVYLYERKTNTLGIYTDDGKTVTFFKPDDGINYWKRVLSDLGY